MGEEVILITSLVSNDPKGFLYSFRIEHTGKNNYLYRWELLEKVLGRDEVILDLEPGSIHQFQVVCKNPPVFESGQTEILRKEKIEDDNFTTSIWVREKCGAIGGPVPIANEFMPETDGIQSDTQRHEQGIR